jgi:hypothetical protein
VREVYIIIKKRKEWAFQCMEEEEGLIITLGYPTAEAITQVLTFWTMNK